MTDATISPTKAIFHRMNVWAILCCVILGLIIIFLLGVMNFALHSAVLNSGHAMLDQMPGLTRALGGRLTLLAEFLVLLGAMLLASNGWAAVAWGYAAYSALNAATAWLILSGRI